MVTKKITRCAIIVAINIVFSFILKFLPNIKPDTTFVIILAVYYTLSEATAVITTTVLIRMCLYGGGTFVPFQWLAWFTVAVLAFLLKKILSKNKILFTIYAGVSGYIFGFIVSLDTLMLYGVNTFLVYWLNGVLFDTFHLVGNFIFSGILLNTVLRAKEVVVIESNLKDRDI